MECKETAPSKCVFHNGFKCFIGDHRRRGEKELAGNGTLSKFSQCCDVMCLTTACKNVFAVQNGVKFVLIQTKDHILNVVEILFVSFQGDLTV